MFYEIYSVPKDTWEKVYGLGWFPFISITGKLFEGLVSRVVENRPTEARQEKLIEYFNEEKILGLLKRFKKQDFLEPHIAFLECGIQRYLDGDYISSINNIWPRVEGILRYAFATGSGHAGLNTLLEKMEDVVANQSISPSIFFPQQFREFLLKYYFKKFDIAAGTLDISRHSIGHGVSGSHNYDRKHALIGILMIDQLVYYLQLKQPSADM